MPLPIPSSEARSHDLLKRHYEIEKALAQRLRVATKPERGRLYRELYDEFFRSVPGLPRLAEDLESQRQVVALQTVALEPFLDKDTVFLEIGAGDCALALELAGRARRVIAVDASAEAVGSADLPDNFELVLTDATELDLDPESVDLAYSCHFLEHLHPEDAADHLVAVRRVLRPGGAYVCVTPNRLWGPHDISKYFDDAPTGFHLREYTHGDLARLFRDCGYRQIRALRGLAQPPRCVALWPYACLEGGLGLLPQRVRRSVMAASLGRLRRSPFRPLEQVQVVGYRTSATGRAR